MNPGAAAPAGGVAFRLEPASLTQAVGSTFAINVILNSSVDAWQVPLQVNYDPRTLQLSLVEASQGKLSEALEFLNEAKSLMPLTTSVRAPGHHSSTVRSTLVLLSIDALTTFKSGPAALVIE